MKAPHPADAANDALIAEAVRFDVSLFLGAGSYARASVATKPEAFVAARRLAAYNPTCSRHPLIYAVNAQGRSAIVPFNLSIEQEPAMNTTTKRSTMKRKTSEKSAQAAEAHTKAEKPRERARKPKASDAAGAKKNAPAKPTGPAKRAPKTAPAAEKPMGKRAAILAAAEIANMQRGGDGSNQHKSKSAILRNSVSQPKAAKMMNVAQRRVEAAAKVKRKAPEVFEKVKAGKMPTPPDFSAATHTRFRPKLAELISLAKSGDIEGLKAYAINPISSSPKAMDRYRNLAVVALEARAAKKAA